MPVLYFISAESLSDCPSATIKETMLSINRGRQFVQYVLPAVLRPLRILWNQIIGFFFLVLTIWAAAGAWRSLRDFKPGDTESLFRVALGAFFIVIMAAYGIYSFWRAHKVPKS